jgi:hypothetical protein
MPLNYTMGSGKRWPSICSQSDINLATERLSEATLALANTLVGAHVVTPIDLQETGEEVQVQVALLKETKKDIQQRGVVLPTARTNFESLQVLKGFIDSEKSDLIPDPMLLLMKAAINWSWRCKQQLLPACHSVHSEQEEASSLASPSTPVSHDNVDDLSLSSSA